MTSSVGRADRRRILLPNGSGSRAETAIGHNKSSLERPGCSVKATDTIGGYDSDIFLSDLEPKYRCGLCLRVLRDPVQTGCGHRFCGSCMEKLRASSVTSIAHCNIDGQPLTKVFPDMFCRREILSLFIRCSNHVSGCCWQGELIGLDKHLTMCSWEETKCPNSGCEQHVQRKHLDEHLQETCSFRKVKCQHCKRWISYRDFEIHVRDDCTDTPKMCPFFCGVVFPRKKLASHVSGCVESLTACEIGLASCVTETLAEGSASLCSSFDKAQCKYFDHLMMCGLKMACCPNNCCQGRLLARHLDEHLQTSCPFRTVTCEYCKESILHSNLKVHGKEICPDVPTKCPNVCGAVLPRKELSLHLTKCLEALSECSFKGIGCTFQGSRREVTAHESDPASAAQHLNLVCKAVSDKTNEMALMQEESDRKDVLLANLLARVEHLELGLSQRTIMFELRIPHLENSIVTSEGSTRSDEALQAHALSTQRVLAADQRHLRFNKIRDGLLQFSYSAIDGFALVESCDAQLDRTSCNGVLIWKINLEKAVADAQSGRKMSLYSPPFYSSRCGYKMCARLYPLGDGIGRSSHISFFFIVMSGKNDDILPWPFQFRVTLALLDQSPAQKDVYETFLPDVKSSSFQRPVSEMNIASGCPRFISHDHLKLRRNAFLKEGVMFLKVSVAKHIAH